jgi:hypothetical protein
MLKASGDVLSRRAPDLSAMEKNRAAEPAAKAS